MSSPDAESSVRAPALVTGVAAALVAAAQLTPLVCGPRLVVWPFVGPKSLFVVLVAAPLAALAVGVAIASRGRWRPPSSPIVLTLVLLAASLLLSTALSVDRHRSWFDDHERMLGTFHLLHVVALGVAAAGLLRTDGAWRAVWRVTLGVSVVVSGVALWQRVDPEFLFNTGGFRVSSTMNHPAFLGGYAVRTALLAWLLVGRERGAGKLLAGVAGLLGAAAAFATETRSAMLGLAAGGAVLLLGTAAYAESRRARRGAVLGLGAVVLAGAAALPLLGLEEERAVLRHRVETGVATAAEEERLGAVERRWEWTTRVPGLRRFTRMSVTRKTASTRLMTWEIALEAGAARPLAGWGPCNYARALEAFHRPAFLAHGYQETWFDHAHSTPLDAFATRGLPGLLVQLALFLVPLVVVVRARRRRRIDARFAVATAALLVAQFTHLLFVFDGASSWVGLAVLLAFLDRETGPRREPIGAGAAGRPMVLGLTLVAGFVWAWWWVTPEWRTARGMQEALDALAAGRGEAAEAAFRGAVEGAPPHADGARNMFAVGVLRQTSRVGSAAPPALGRLCEVAFEALGENRTLHPEDVRVILRRAKLARELAARFGDASRLETAVAELDLARELSPRRQEVVFLLAELGPAVGRSPAELVPLLRAAAESEPSVGEAWLRLAMAHELDGRSGVAAEVLAEGLAAGARFTAAERRAVDAVLEKTGHRPGR